MSHWREKSARIIRDVLVETAGKSEAEIKKAIHEAYPFGERRYHPYKIWLDEVRRQRKPLIKRGPCGACSHSQGSHQGRYGRRDARCYAADCECGGYRVTAANQGVLAL